MRAVRSLAMRAPIAISVTDEGIGRCSPPVEAAIYFCSVEAVQNAIKHAGRNVRVGVTVGRGRDRVHFAISDDGVGIDQSAPGDGDGLIGMRDRVGAVGGELEIISSPGRGTTVRGTIPAARHPARGRARRGVGVRIRVVVGEDNYLAREGICRVLEAEQDIEIVAACGDLATLRDAVGDAAARRGADRYPDAADQHRRGHPAGRRAAHDPPRRRGGDPQPVRRAAVCHRAAGGRLRPPRLPAQGETCTRTKKQTGTITYCSTPTRSDTSCTRLIACIFA